MKIISRCPTRFQTPDVRQSDRLQTDQKFIQYVNNNSKETLDKTPHQSSSSLFYHQLGFLCLILFNTELNNIAAFPALGSLAPPSNVWVYQEGKTSGRVWKFRSCSVKLVLTGKGETTSTQREREVRGEGNRITGYTCIHKLFTYSETKTLQTRRRRAATCAHCKCIHLPPPLSALSPPRSSLFVFLGLSQRIGAQTSQIVDVQTNNSGREELLCWSGSCSFPGSLLLSAWLMNVV